MPTVRLHTRLLYGWFCVDDAEGNDLFLCRKATEEVFGLSGADESITLKTYRTPKKGRVKVTKSMSYKSNRMFNVEGMDHPYPVCGKLGDMLNEAILANEGEIHVGCKSFSKES